MIKLIFFLLASLTTISINSFSQSLPITKRGNILLRDTIHFSGLSQKEIYLRVREWAFNNCLEKACQVVMDNAPGKFVYYKSELMHNSNLKEYQDFKLNYMVMIDISYSDIVFALTHFEFVFPDGSRKAAEFYNYFNRPQQKDLDLEKLEVIKGFATTVKTEIVQTIKE